jgi:glycosyltransferase involved in cell wall biosynthesis
MADAIVLYSRTVADDYIRRGMPKEKVFVALNSLNPAPMQDARARILADPEGLEAFQREHGLRDDAGKHPVIVYVSRLDPNNRVPMLVEATQKLLGEFPTLKTVIIGKGPDLDNVKADRRAARAIATTCAAPARSTARTTSAPGSARRTSSATPPTSG